MKDFLQNNFPELLLSGVIIVLAIVLLFSVHWHDETTASWARNTIGAVIVGISTLLNALKQPRANGTTSITEKHEDPKPEVKKK
jgi:hypothetical protein